MRACGNKSDAEQSCAEQQELAEAPGGPCSYLSFFASCTTLVCTGLYCLRPRNYSILLLIILANCLEVEGFSVARAGRWEAGKERESIH